MILKHRIMQLFFVLLMFSFVVTKVQAGNCKYRPIAKISITEPKNKTLPYTVTIEGTESHLGSSSSTFNQSQYCGYYNRFDTVAYNWASSDGQTNSGSVVKFTYYKSGIYNITLTIKNPSGDEDKASVSVNIPAPATKPSVCIDRPIAAVTPTDFRVVDLNGSTDEGLKKCKSNPHSYGLFTQADIDNAKSTAVTTDKCKTNPRSCGLYTKAEIDKAKSAVVTTDKCKTNPGSCGLYTKAEIDKAKSTAVTTDKCKTNPRSCGLYTKAEIDKAKLTEGTTDKCKTNPRSCGLYTKAEIDKAKSTAGTTDKCKTNPRSCGLYTKIEIDKAKSTAVTTDKCKTNPHSCGLFTQAEIDAANSKNPTADKCKTNPYACGLFAKVDIETAGSENFAKGQQICINNPEACGINVNSSESNVTLSNNLEMRIPLLSWNQFLSEEEKQLWADLVYLPSEDNRILFEVIDYGFH